eukprot:TRINITY_DN13240_c0_g2_i1.p1 TRINITY_DN13240_c0_g2~~TRINITY_DN13240_c0_g2_i1.p1  ORF type:complete len:574 (+),score=105.50 TRINITY_DN13240_c0_g2_i1:161-1882(+)
MDYDTFRAQVAADLFGAKENLYVKFENSLPSSIQELEEEVKRVYQAEVRAACPRGVSAPIFEIEYMQYFEDGEWIDLVSVGQLYQDMQIFVFQPRTSIHSDNQDLIPVAKEPVCKANLKMSRAMPAPRQAKPAIDVEEVFTVLDRDNRGGIVLEDIRDCFQQLGVDLSSTTVASLFGLPPPESEDALDDRTITFEDLRIFSTSHPSLMSAIQQHIIDPTMTEPDLVMADIVSDQQKKLDMLQKAHKEALSRKQKESIQRLTKGKSSKITESEINNPKPATTKREPVKRQPSVAKHRSTSPAVTKKPTSQNAFGRSVTQHTASTAKKKKPASTRTGTPTRGTRQSTGAVKPQGDSNRPGEMGRMGYSAVPGTMFERRKSMSPRRNTKAVEIESPRKMEEPAVAMPSTEAYMAMEEQMNWTGQQRVETVLQAAPVAPPPSPPPPQVSVVPQTAPAAHALTQIELLRRGHQSPTYVRDVSVSQAPSTAILSPGGSSIPLPVAAPPVQAVLPLQLLDDPSTLPPPRSVSHSIPLPSPSPAYQPSLTPYQHSATPASPISGSTRRWYPNLVSPAMHGV